MPNTKLRLHGLLKPASIITLLISSFVLVYSCGEQKTTTEPSSNTPSGMLIELPYSCKPLSREDPEAISPDRECFKYRYDGASSLELDHINTAFNCCPEEIVADITIENDTIIISESETGGLCDCICLFDLSYKISGLEPSEYTIIFKSPYLGGGDSILTATINLSDSTYGIACVKRDCYPWHSTDSSGRIVNHTGCKNFNATKHLPSAEDYSSNDDCVIYQYGADYVLVLNHINAGFNCCPTALTADFEFANDTITIIENEVLDNPCHCLCLYDLTLEITDIAPGAYTIIIKEIYTKRDDAPLQFKVNLIEQPRGTCCVKRAHYPWGL